MDLKGLRFHLRFEYIFVSLNSNDRRAIRTVVIAYMIIFAQIFENILDSHNIPIFHFRVFFHVVFFVVVAFFIL